MDLIGGYLLVLVILFGANISLLLGNNKLDNFKVIGLSILMFITSFGFMYISSFLDFDLLDYLSYFFLAIFILMVLAMLIYVKKDNLKSSLMIIIALFLISTLIFASQSTLNIFDMILYSLFGFIIFFVVYQLSKLLHYAKRQYSVIVGEYMTLFSILMFIFTLTYNSTQALDYSMFNAFLILTPTYQLIYVVIAIVVILVVGVVINDSKGGNP